jgi:hypothetical protein
MLGNMRASAALIVPLLLATAPVERGAILPVLRAEALSGRVIELPSAARGRVALVAFGFTRGSGDAIEAWGDRFRQAYGADSTFVCYEIPVLGGLARLAAPMIRRGMRKGSRAAHQDDVLLLWNNTSDWKQRLGYESGDAPHLVLLDREGRIRWRHAGAPDESSWSGLSAAITSIR